VAACLQLNRSGLSEGKSGNISIRVGDAMLITPSGVDYNELKPSALVRMDFYGTSRSRSRPSSEWRMHGDIYREFTHAGAVVHAHPPYATALACQRRKIPAFHYMVAVAGGIDIRCASYATFGTEALSQNMLRALRGRSACLLANHGIICFGRDLGEAMWRAGEAEALAKQYVLALAMGEPPRLNKTQMAEVLEKFKTYGVRDE